jgi:hypothetical protein
MKSTIAAPIRIARAPQGRCMKSASADFMKWNDQRGGSLVEFAIIAPLLFVILFGIIEFGILLYDQAMITNASREGARTGIVFNHPNRITDANIEQVVRNYCEDNLISFETDSELSITVIREDEDGNPHLNAAGDPLTVRVIYPFHFLVFSNLLALIGGGMENLVNLSAETIMRLE